MIILSLRSVNMIQFEITYKNLSILQENISNIQAYCNEYKNEQLLYTKLLYTLTKVNAAD